MPTCSVDKIKVGQGSVIPIVGGCMISLDGFHPSGC